MNGVVYYNRGRKLLVRLIVSLYSLRQHWTGPITILSEGDHEACEKIAKWFQCELIRVTFPTVGGKNEVFVNACLVGKHTPYDVTTWIDSDTLVVGEIYDLFTAAEEHEFAIAQFADWTTHRGRIYKRIKAWEGLLPEQWIAEAIALGPAVNCGVFAFHKRSSLVRDWYSYAVKGLATMIPDEVCCQILLAQYPHKIMPPEFNVSCKYGEPFSEDNRIVHYHGRKHCRYTQFAEGKDKKTGEGKGNGGCPQCADEKDCGSMNRWNGSEDEPCADFRPILQYGGELWLSTFDKVSYMCREWIDDDRQLKHNLPIWEERK